MGLSVLLTIIPPELQARRFYDIVTGEQLIFIHGVNR